MKTASELKDIMMASRSSEVIHWIENTLMPSLVEATTNGESSAKVTYNTIRDTNIKNLMDIKNTLDTYGYRTEVTPAMQDNDAYLTISWDV